MIDDENEKILIPLIRKRLPTLMAQQILNVQPMILPSPKFWFSSTNPLEVILSFELLISKEFYDWCSLNNLKIIREDFGRVNFIVFNSEEEKSWFLLRWS